MPTVLTHPALPLAVGLGLGRDIIAPRLLVAGVAASVLPDLDVLAFRLGVPYGSALGHRGLTNSLVFAVLVALLGLAFIGSWPRSPRPRSSSCWWPRARTAFSTPSPMAGSASPSCGHFRTSDSSLRTR